MTSNWKECKIGDIVEIRRGASPRPIHQFISNKGMPWVKIADATSDNSRYIRKTNEFIIYDGVKYSVLVEPETLIVSNSATPGLPKIMKIQACVHDGWLVFSNYQGLLRDFLYYKFIGIQKKLLNQANGSVFQNLKTDIVKDFDILLPPLETQQKIAKVLSAIDDKIELNNSINNNLEQQAMALFKQKIIENCDNKNGTIGDYCSVKSGYAFKGTWWQDCGVKVVKIKTIDNDTINFNDCSYVSEDKVQYAKDFIVQGGDLLIAMTGATIGKFAVIPKINEPLLVNQRVGKFFLGTEPLNRLAFLYCSLKQQDTITEIINRGQGSAQPNISSTDIMTTPCYLPNKYVIDEFNELCKPIFETIITNKYENEQTRKKQQYLFHMFIFPNRTLPKHIHYKNNTEQRKNSQA